jgi:protein-S-isoprenylcysteine O-methyltransferase Ste14
LEILWQRAKLMRAAIASVSAATLFAALLIVGLFVSNFFHIENSSWLIGGLFVLAMAALILALSFFLIDVNRSLTALGLELGGNMDRSRAG